MGDELLANILSRYRASAIAHGIASDSGDYKATWTHYHRLIKEVKAIRAIGDAGAEALGHLMEDRSPYVRLVAATHCLGTDEHRAMSVLMDLVSEKGSCGLDASMTLKEWAAGRLIIP